MTAYRPICDTWILARPRVKYYGAYPLGFLHRARALLGVHESDSVLHLCSGKVKEYPYGGFGPNDVTLDIDRELGADIICDLRDGVPPPAHWFGRTAWASTSGDAGGGWPAILADPPYTEEDAKQYCSGKGGLVFPSAQEVLEHSLKAVAPGSRVGILHYLWPRPPTEKRIGFKVKPVAAISVLVGFGNRVRLFSVFEREPTK